MISIDENQLKLLLENKKKILERPKYDGLGEIVSSISLMITLVLSDYSHLTVVNSQYFIIIAWGISIIIFAFGNYTLIKSLKDKYSMDQLYNEILDIDPEIEHPFDIILIKSNDERGRYLVYKSKRWKCWLFPNYRCFNSDFSKSKETRYIKECVKRDLNLTENIDLIYIGNEISKKYSVGDKVMKKYNFHYFYISNVSSKFGNKRKFLYNGKKYCWKTLDQMYVNKNIVKKNVDVLDYIRHMCDIS